jgi:hypothetical protein
MLDISTYLAKVIGINMLIISILLLIKPREMKAAMDAIFANPGLVFLLGLLTTIFGTILIVLHNEWFLDWPLVITILAWIVFLRGLARLFIANTLRNFTQKFSKIYTYRFSGIAGLLIAIFLIYNGFFA